MSLLQLHRMVSGNWDRPITMDLRAGEVLLLLGRNGAGKTTLLNTIAGLIPVRSGTVRVGSRNVTAGDERQRIAQGIRIALEGRQIFRRLSVRKNLLLGAYPRRGQVVAQEIDMLTALFPMLAAKLDHSAGSLSGGQQTLLSVSRALMGRPSFLLLDEPTLGLDPQNIQKLAYIVERIARENGTGVLVAEQMGAFTRALPRRVALLIGGELVFNGSLDEAERNGWIEQALL